jgi:hypothetical protein
MRRPVDEFIRSLRNLSWLVMVALCLLSPKWAATGSLLERRSGEMTTGWITLTTTTEVGTVTEVRLVVSHSVRDARENSGYDGYVIIDYRITDEETGDVIFQETTPTRTKVRKEEVGLRYFSEETGNLVASVITPPHPKDLRPVGEKFTSKDLTSEMLTLEMATIPSRNYFEASGKKYFPLIKAGVRK